MTTYSLQTKTLDYLKSHYLTLEQLSIEAKVSCELIKQFVDHKCIPPHSYTTTSQLIVSTEVFGDHTFQENINYYSSGIIPWIERASCYHKIFNLNETAVKIHADFFESFRNALINIKHANLAFPTCFDAQGDLLDSKAQLACAECWKFIMDGTYGVCLKNISAENIIIKAVSLAIMEKFIKANPLELSNEQLIEFHDAIKNYDAVVTEFSPHEVAQSSRGRVVNILKLRYFPATS